MTPRRVRDLRAGEDGSMSILLLVAMVGLIFGALLVPTVITTSRATSFDKTRVQALDAAQAGVNVTLGAIRASVVNGAGVTAKLPCGPGSGDLGGSPAATYTTVVEYFTADPAVKSDARLMRCVPGYGPYDTTTLATTPGIARITSTGAVSSTAKGAGPPRTLVSTYVFRTSDEYTVGGQVRIDAGTTSPLCMDVGTNPVAGSPVVVRTCSTVTPPAAQQVFAYRNDLTLQLVSSVTTPGAPGLCIASARVPAVAGDAAVLAVCGPLNTAKYEQVWSYNDDGRYQAAQADSATTGALPNLCLNVNVQSVGQAVVVGTCGNTSWVPSASLGAGGAALPQWVNFSEFGRCLDVTNQNTNSTFLIDYPCKQNPYPAAKTWNQLFDAPVVSKTIPSASGPISTITGGVRYCLTSPGTDGGSVTVKPCVAGSAAQTWTVYGDAPTLSYSMKYTIVSGTLCLGLGAPNPLLNTWSSIASETCSGATDQKWNATASELSSAIKDTYEK